MLVAALLVAWGPAAPATEVARRGDVELRWTAPAEGCPDADAVLDDALGLLGDAPPPALGLRVVATVTHGEGFVLSLRVGEAGDGAARTLAAPRCDELARAAALLTAMAIDPTVASRVPEPPIDATPRPPEPVVPPEPAELPSPPPVAVRSPPARDDPKAPPPRRGPALHASALLGVGVGAFALPRPTAALAFAVALAVARARVEIGGSWWTPVRRSSPSNPDIGGRFTLAVATVRGCFAPRWRTLEFPLCGVAVAGVMSGRGTGALPEPLSARAPWVALGGGPTLLWRPRRAAGRLGLFARVEGLGSLTRPAFETAPSGLLWRAEAGALVAVAGAELRFWSRP